MTIKDLGGKVASVWEGLRPVTRNLLVGALQTENTQSAVNKFPKSLYDAHSDWELSNLLTVLDERTTNAEVRQDSEALGELTQLADTCARVLETQSASAEVFIQLAERALRKYDYDKLDDLADRLNERFAAPEIAEIIRQTVSPQIRAIAYETLAMLPVSMVSPLLDDPLYADIAFVALEQKAYEFESEEARDLLDHIDSHYTGRG